MNEIVSEDGTEMMGNKIKSKAKGSMDEHSAPAGDSTQEIELSFWLFIYMFGVPYETSLRRYSKSP